MDIERLISELTLAEKVTLLAGKSLWQTEPIERLGIPSITMTDGPHGVRLGGFDPDTTAPATAFPVEAALAATWDPALIEDAGKAMAEECQFYDVSVLLGPGANGKRSPLGGRNFEYYSEDPTLTASIATAFVRGVQSGGVGTSLKHYVANEQETNRMVTSSQVDERTLREIYLLPFETVVRDAKPWTVMCAYNRVNGIHMAQNHPLLNGVLKGEWGYEGLVMSDWGAVVDKLDSVRGGLDLEMPGPGLRNEEVIAAVERSELSLEEIDDHVRRFLSLVDTALSHKRSVDSVDFDAHHQLAARVCAESTVLLKNDEELLPLASGARIAVLGEFARSPRIQGGGSSHMNPAWLSTPLEELKSRAEISFAPGYSDETTSEDLIAAAVAAARKAEGYIVFVGTTDRVECEGYDRADLQLPVAHVALLEAVCEVTNHVVVVNMSGSAVDLRPVAERAQAILHCWLGGQGIGLALARVLFGEEDPGGRLTETFPLEVEHNPSFLSFPGTIDSVEYSEGLFVGYRFYDARKLPVAYPFGYGLSYTSFSYDQLSVEETSSEGGRREYDVHVTVRNTGSRRGTEVVQIYVRDVESFQPRPLRELKGFARVSLGPEESTTVTIHLDWRAFATYVVHLGSFAVEAGEFVIEAGSSSRCIRLSQTVSVDSPDEVRPALTPDHDLRTYLSDEHSRDTVAAAYELVAESCGHHQILDSLAGMPIRLVFSFLPMAGASKESIRALQEAVEAVRRR